VNDVTRQRWLTAAVVLVALPVLADVYLGLFNGIAARLEHTALQVVLGLAVGADQLGLVEHDAFLVQSHALIGGLALFLAAGAIDRGAESRARSALGAAFGFLIGVPALLAVLATIGLGALLAPEVFVFGIVGGFAAITLKWTGPVIEPSRTGLPPYGRVPAEALRAAILVGVALLVANGLTLLTSGPGDRPTPLAFQAIADVLWNPGPVASAALAAGLGAIAGFVLLRRGLMPLPLLSPQPLRCAGRLLVPLFAGVAALVHVATTGHGDCESVIAQPEVRLVSDLPGTFALQPVPGGVIVSFRDRGVLARIGDDGSLSVVDVADIPLKVWERLEAATEESDDRSRIGYPEELGLDPAGRVHAFVEIPTGEGDMVLLLLDAATGDVVQVHEDDDHCLVSSWAWDEPRGRSIAGCEWIAEVMVFGPEGGALQSRMQFEGAGEMEELLVDPKDGTWLAVSLWTSPYLHRLDPSTGEIVDRAYVGSFNWGLTLDEGAREIHLARFHARQILVLDADTLEAKRTLSVGYGIRPIVLDPAHGRVLTASTYDGYLYAADIAGVRPTERLRLGGLVRDIDLSPDGSTLYAGGACGVMAIDLDDWLD
jgi:hypothetical protein